MTASRSPWQNAYVDRVISSIRRERRDYVVIFKQRHLRRVLASYVDYHRTRTIFQGGPTSTSPVTHTRGKVIAIAQVGGLHLLNCAELSQADSYRIWQICLPTKKTRLVSVLSSQARAAPYFPGAPARRRRRLNLVPDQQS